MSALFTVLLLLSYLVFVYYILKGGNLLMGFILMAVVWIPIGVIGGQIDWAAFNSDIMQKAPSNIGTNVVLIFVGSWLGQVLLKTGIASTLIKKAVELGGDKPIFTAILLSILTTLIFCSAYGAGAVIGIGVIVLPIMLSLGVPKALATASFLMSVGAGMYTNAVIWGEKQAVLGLADTNPEYTYQSYQSIGIVATAVQLVIIIIMLIVMINRKKTVHSWAAPVGSAQPTSSNAPLYAMIAPFMPVILMIAFKWNSLPAFLAAIFYALITCGYAKNLKDFGETINRTLYDGIMDAAPLIGFLFFQGIFTAAANKDAAFFQDTLGGIIPASTLALCLIFAIGTPLGLFRGPLSVFGVGPVLFAVINGLGIFEVPFLFAVFQLTGIATTISSCVTQSWNIWAVNYNKVSTKDFMMTAFPWCWVVNIINMVILYVRLG